MSNIITTIDLRGTTTKKILIDDNFNYTSLGWDISDVRGVVSVVGPEGSVYSNDDFADPDIIPSISRRCTRTINLPLDPESGYTQVLKGNYTVRLVVKNIDTGDEEEEILTYSYQLTAPEIESTITAGPYSGILKSTDTTDYQDPYSLTREHRIQYPTQLSPAQDDIVSTLAEVEVTPIYTNTWTVIITSEAEWRNPDELRILWDGTDTFTKCVYGGCITAMYDAIETMLTSYQEGTGHNTGNQERYQKRLVIANTAWHLLNVAYMAGDVDEADKQANIIQDQVEYSGAGICNGTTSEEVIPCPAYEPGEVIGGVDYTFTNGITRTVDTVKLGGTLTDNTTISVSDKYLTIGATSGSDYSSIKTLLTSHEIAVGDGATEGNIKIEKDKVTLYYKDIATPSLSRGYEIGADGLIEKADYSENYTDRALISKSYFDNNNDWGTQVVVSGASLTGNGTVASPLAVASPFPGFDTLENDYGYVEPTHAFSEITDTPTTLAGYGITDAVTAFLGLSDTPSSYTGHGSKFVTVNAGATGLTFTSSGAWVPSTGGTFTGQVIFNVNNNYPIALRKYGSGGSPGTPQAAINKLGFQDGDEDLQGEVGMDASGNLVLNTFVSGGIVTANSDIVIDGTYNGVDIQQLKNDFDGHAHDDLYYTITFSDSWFVHLVGDETVAGAKTFTGANIFYSGQKINNPANTYAYTLTSGAITANRTLNLPVITGTDTLVTLGLAQTFAATITFPISFNITNPEATHAYSLTAGDITDDRVLKLPIITDTDTLAVLGLAQTFSGALTLSATPLTLSANSAILSFSSSTGVKQITTGGSTNLALMPGGNVGINTESPSEKLDINGNIKASSIKITTGATSGYYWRCTNVSGAGEWASIAASTVYKGTWDADINDPTLEDGQGTAGWYYRVIEGGIVNFGSGNITFAVGDDVYYNGATWENVPGTAYVLQVATDTVLGGVKIGDGVDVDVNGVISVEAYEHPATHNPSIISQDSSNRFVTDAQITNWNTAYSWGDHAGLYVGLTGNENVAGIKTFTNQIKITAGSPGAGKVLMSDADGLASWSDSTYTFTYSILYDAGIVTLENDSASPGATKYYGTNSLSAKGWYSFPAPNTHASSHASGGSDPVNHNTLQNYVAAQHIRWDQSGAETLYATRMPLFTSTVRGSVPASGGESTKVLLADGTWQSYALIGFPAGTEGQVIQYISDHWTPTNKINLGAGASIIDSGSELYSVAIGHTAEVIGTNCVAIGRLAETEGDGCVSIGYAASSISYSVSIGKGSLTGFRATALGYHASASDDGIALGYDTMAHVNSVAIGTGVETTETYQVMIGTSSHVINSAGILQSSVGRRKKVTFVSSMDIITNPQSNHILLCANTSSRTVYLNTDPSEGEEYVIKRCAAGGVTINGYVNGDGHSIRMHDGTVVTHFEISSYRSYTLIYNGINYWEMVSNAA